jgi:hypothetical protein
MRALPSKHILAPLIALALAAGAVALAVAQTAGPSVGSTQHVYLAADNFFIGATYPLPTQSLAYTGATGRLKSQRVAAAASTNSTNVKASAGNLYGWHLGNGSASIRFVKLYNKATAPTCGTDTPVQTIILAASGGRSDSVGDIGVNFPAGIGFCITGAVADSDTTAVAANDVHGELLYQ